MDHYGRPVPKGVHGSIRLDRFTSSAHLLIEAMMTLYDRMVDPHLLVRRMCVAAGNVVTEKNAGESAPEQMDMFTDYARREKEDAALRRERDRQRAVVEIKRRFGKNALLKGMNFQEGATARDRNAQIGGHRA
jgi:DNA polymerase V